MVLNLPTVTNFRLKAGLRASLFRFGAFIRTKTRRRVLRVCIRTEFVSGRDTNRHSLI
jgi:hypothetical protein